MAIDRASILATVCSYLAGGNSIEAAQTIRRDHPFDLVALVGRKYGEAEVTRVFARDGFIDRYSGAGLIFPGVLRVLSLELPVVFPFHPNWKMSETHEAFWESSPTVDHIVPVSRGGADSDENWVTTSMRRHSAKANWTLEELGWIRYSPGDLSEWDGLIGWFQARMQSPPDLLENAHVRRWHRGAVAVAAR